MTVYYVDFEGGNDSNNGLTFANRKATTNSISLNEGDEIRVMATAPATSIGNATWGQQQTGPEDYCYQVHDEGGNIRVTLTSNVDGIYPDNGYAIIRDSTLTNLNGIWKTTAHANGGFLLQGSNFTTLAVSSGSSAGGGKLISINGKIVRIAQELVSDVQPNAWDAVQVANPVTAWVNNPAGADGVTNGSSYYPGSAPFKSIPGTSWRIAWNNTGTDVTVTEQTYVDNRAASSSWSNRYIGNNYYGGTNYTTSVYLGSYYRHIFGTYNGYYVAINTNSYMQFGSYASTNTNHSASNPATRQFQIGARDSEAYYIRYRAVSASNSTSWSDISSSTGYLIWFYGNRQDSSQTVRPGYPVVGGTDAEIEWTAFYFSNNSIKNNAVMQVDIHNNVDWSQQTIIPSTASVAGFYDLGTQFNCGGVSANTTAFWHNYATTRDLSSFDSLSFFMSVSGVFTNNWKLRLHQGAYDSGASYLEVALPVTTTGSTYTPVSVNFGTSMPNNIQAISIHYDGSSDITDSVSFSISNILATSSTGIGFGSLIGRNDSTSKSWYKIGALRYVNNETLVTLGNVNNLVESTPGGISYYGTSDRSQIPDTNDVANISSDTVTTYVREPYQLSAAITSNRDRVQIRGGWNRTDMSTQDGITMIQPPDDTQGLYLTHDGIYAENFYVHGGNYGYDLETAYGTELVNCNAGYNSSSGFLVESSNNSIIKDSTVTAANEGVLFLSSGACDLRSVVLDGCGIGMRFSQYTDSIDTYDLVIRGALTDSVRGLDTMNCTDFNPYILSHGDCYDLDTCYNHRVIGGNVELGLHQSGSVIFRNTSNSTLSFKEMEEVIYSYSAATSVHAVGSASYNAYGNDGSVARYYNNAGIWLRRNSTITAPSGTLPDGSTDPGNKVYQWERSLSTETGKLWPPGFNIGCPRVKIGDVPCAAGSTVTVTAKVQHQGYNYGRLFVRCSAAESTCGLTQDVLEYWPTPASSNDTNWYTYSTDITIPQSGVATIYLHYGTTSTSGGTNTRIHYTDLQVTST